MHSESELPLVLICPLMMKSMIIIGESRELHQAKLSPTMKSAIINVDYKSLPRKGLGNDAMSKALNQISKSPFTHKIEGAKLPRRFHQPTFTIYNGRTDPVDHVSQFNQRITVHSKDEALMCKVFPSSLGLVTMRWFDGLKTNSINSFKELT